jgi:hypothetical protein
VEPLLDMGFEHFTEKNVKNVVNILKPNSPSVVGNIKNKN